MKKIQQSKGKASKTCLLKRYNIGLNDHVAHQLESSRMTLDDYFEFYFVLFHLFSFEKKT